MIEISHLEKSFGRKKVLRNISLDISQPGVIAILGPNGSGKTTLIKSLMGLVIPDSGTIKIDSEHILGNFLYRQKISYLPQIAHFPENLKVLELLEWIKRIRKESSREEKLLELFDLNGFIEQKLHTLSGGTRQRVNLVLALMFDQPLIILDEPTVGLDPVALVTLKSLLREERHRGKYILISTHIMDFVEEMATRIIYLLEGQLHYDGSLHEMKKQYGEVKLEEVIFKILKGNGPMSMNGRETYKILENK